MPRPRLWTVPSTHGPLGFSNPHADACLRHRRRRRLVGLPPTRCTAGTWGHGWPPLKPVRPWLCSACPWGLRPWLRLRLRLMRLRYVCLLRPTPRRNPRDPTAPFSIPRFGGHRSKTGGSCRTESTTKLRGGLLSPSVDYMGCWAEWAIKACMLWWNQHSTSFCYFLSRALSNY